jgi:hypothetical protein
MSIGGPRYQSPVKAREPCLYKPNAFHQRFHMAKMMAMNQRTPSLGADEVKATKSGVTLRGFKGYLANKDYAEQVLAPAYDTLNTEEARKMAAENQRSFLFVNKPEIALDAQ